VVVAVAAGGSATGRPATHRTPEFRERRERLPSCADRGEVAPPFGAFDGGFESVPAAVCEEGRGLRERVERGLGLGHDRRVASLGRVVGERPERALH